MSTPQPKAPRRRIRDRSTGDLLVLMVASTVCFSVLASGAVIAIISISQPGTDVSNWIARVTGIMNTMVGLLAGFLAGRTDVQQRRRDDERGPEGGPL